MMTKKILSLVLALMLVLSLAACGASDVEETSPESTETQSSQPEETAESVAEETEESEAEIEEQESEPVEESEAEEEVEIAEGPTEEEKQAALEDAKKILNIQPFSYYGIIEYLEMSEGHSNEAATYAADNCGADWNEMAVGRAQWYLNSQSFTREDLIAQLEYDWFTTEQATYGVDGAGL